MKPSNSSKPAAEIVAAIRALDLDPIKVKLMEADEGQGWSREYADRMEVAYKRFLTLLVTHPETTVAPSKEIDKFWHAHILDTMKYADDCQQVFGYFLHHFPYFGLRGADDAAQLAQAGQEMERLYEQEFGEAMPVAKGTKSAFCFAAKPATQSAFCFAAKPAAQTAFCFAAKPAVKSAFCFAAKPEAKSAFCFAAKPTTQAAFCFAAKPAVKSAFCFAAKPEVKSAFCFAARPATQAAFCFASGTTSRQQPDAATRPTLALAA